MAIGNKHIVYSRANNPDISGWGVAISADTKKDFQRKISVADNEQVISFFDDAFKELIKSHFEDDGISSLRKFVDLINNWRPVEESRLKVKDEQVLNEDICNLKEWESSLVNVFSSLPEAKHIILYRNRDETFLRVVIDTTNMEVIHRLNHIYIKEQLEKNIQERIDFLVIDQCIYENSTFPKDALIVKNAE